MNYLTKKQNNGMDKDDRIWILLKNWEMKIKGRLQKNIEINGDKIEIDAAEC